MLQKLKDEKGPLKYTNEKYGFKVITRQEKSLLFTDLKSVEQIGENEFKVDYSQEPQKDILSSKNCRSVDSNSFNNWENL